MSRADKNFNLPAVEASEFAENLIDTIREPLIALNKDLRVVKASRSFYDFFKVGPEETLGTRIYDLGNNQWNIPKLRDLLETILPEKTTFDNYEVEHDFSTIGKRIMLLNARKIQREGGKEQIILLVIEDITERKAIEAGLEKTRKELVRIKNSADEASEFAENLIDTIHEPLIALDKDLRVVKVSQSFYDFFKVSSEETIGTLIYELGNHQWNIPKLRELLETILPEKKSFENYEVEHDFTTIGKRIMLLKGRKIQRGSGKEQIILLSIEDITERKAIEAGLEKTRKDLVRIKNSADEVSEFAENLIDTIREPLIALDKDLRVVKASRSFYDIFKVGPEETIGTLIYDLGNHQWDIPKLRELLETILPEKKSIDNYEVEHDFPIIGKRIMLLNARKIERGSGTEQIILLSIEDITERKWVEEEVKLINEKLLILNSEKDKFFSIIAHDLKSPFQGFLGLTQNLAEDATSYSAEELSEIGKEMYKTANRLFRLLRNLLEWAQMQKGSINFEPKIISLQNMIADNVEIIKVRSKKKSITIINTVTINFQAYADENMINSVLHNLLSNAVKFTHRNGTVTVNVNNSSDQTVQVSVNDSGIGINNSILDKLFKVGERIGSEGTEGEDSTGLGLLLCKEFVEKNRGKIWVESEEGKGSTFYFTLPSYDSVSDSS